MSGFHTLHLKHNQKNYKYMEILYQMKPSRAANRKAPETRYPL